MDINAAPFRAFLTVARHESFTRAATELNISQPALSATIRELERRIGFQLFDRTSRRVALTWEGRALLINAQRVVLEHDWAVQRAKEIRGNDLRLVVQPLSVLISERVALTDAFAASHPDAEIQIVHYGSARIYDAVRNNDADIAIVLEPAHRLELSPLNPTLGEDFESLTIASRRLGLFVPPTHRLAAVSEISLVSLKNLQIATVSRVHGATLSTAVMRYLVEHGAEPIRIPEGDAISVMRYSERHSVCGIDTGWFDRIAPQSSLLRKPIAGGGLETELVILRRRREQRPTAERFWRYVANANRPLGAGSRRRE